VEIVIRHEFRQQQPLTLGKRLIHQFRAVEVYEIEGVELNFYRFRLCACSALKLDRPPEGDISDSLAFQPPRGGAMTRFARISNELRSGNSNRSAR
jgi:hypothetical protein